MIYILLEQFTPLYATCYVKSPIPPIPPILSITSSILLSICVYHRKAKHKEVIQRKEKRITK